MFALFFRLVLEGSMGNPMKAASCRKRLFSFGGVLMGRSVGVERCLLVVAMAIVVEKSAILGTNATF